MCSSSPCAEASNIPFFFISVDSASWWTQILHKVASMSLLWRPECLTFFSFSLDSFQDFLSDGLSFTRFSSSFPHLPGVVFFFALFLQFSPCLLHTWCYQKGSALLQGWLADLGQDFSTPLSHWIWATWLWSIVGLVSLFLLLFGVSCCRSLHNAHSMGLVWGIACACCLKKKKLHLAPWSSATLFWSWTNETAWQSNILHLFYDKILLNTESVKTRSELCWKYLNPKLVAMLFSEVCKIKRTSCSQSCSIHQAFVKIHSSVLALA